MPKRRDFDWNQIANMCEIQCTQAEIAKVMGCEENTLRAACKRDNKKDWAQFYAEHRAAGCISLRRSQWKKAITNLDTTMLIFLGKNMLGQKDKVENDVNMSGGQTINVDLSALSKEQLKEIMRDDEEGDK